MRFIKGFVMQVKIEVKKELIKKYIIEKAKELEAKIVTVKDNRIVVKRSEKLMAKIDIDIFSICELKKQLEFIKEIFKKLNDLTDVICIDNHNWEDLDKNNLELGTFNEYELIHGSLLGKVDFKIKIIDRDVEKEEFEVLKTRIKNELKRLDKLEKLFVAIGKNYVYVGKSYKSRCIRVCYCDKKVESKIFTLYYTQAQEERVKKAVEVIEEIVNKYKKKLQNPKEDSLIKKLIEEKDSLNKTAKKIGVLPQRLHYWIKNNSFPVLYISKIAKALDISEDELLELIEEEAKRRGEFY